MTTTDDIRESESLRPAVARPARGDVASGPFGMGRLDELDRSRADLQSALGTGLLVMYPVAASVVVVLVSLAFGGTGVPV